VPNRKNRRQPRSATLASTARSRKPKRRYSHASKPRPGVEELHGARTWATWPKERDGDLRSRSKSRSRAAARVHQV